MELIVLQILCGSGFCLGLFLWTLAPVLVAQRSRSKAPNKVKRERIQYGLGLANCFACGVFLATCFYGMIPHMRHQLQAAVIQSQNGSLQSGIWSDCLQMFNQIPSVELLLLTGFLLTVFIEELGQFCHSSTKTTRVHEVSTNLGEQRNKTTNGTLSVNFSSQAESEPLVSLSSDDADGEEIDLTADILPAVSTKEEDHHSHGHHHHIPSLNGSDLSFRSLALMFGLGVHNLFEGLALGLQDSNGRFLNVLLGILIHEVLCAFAFGISLAQQRLRMRSAVIIVLVYMSCVPMGMSSGILLQFGRGSGALVARLILEGIAAGTFIYVATVEMFATEFRHSHHHTDEDSHSCTGLLKLLMVLLGCGCFIFLNILSHG